MMVAKSSIGGNQRPREFFERFTSAFTGLGKDHEHNQEPMAAAKPHDDSRRQDI